ncbi:hypothetical protein BXZ70DRAFT_91610 [Cristinia sonorae]|uniref:Glycosyl transferase family 25 domain-containing protein n=1 Tax=Cristinia sonorae TaxID=1940300 RepID=A0A8K0XQK3_9AGAR|nr:hypothetical protein BXZ70DRAFT_91610 [Cristinia sonorae]
MISVHTRHLLVVLTALVLLSCVYWLVLIPGYMDMSLRLLQQLRPSSVERAKQIDFPEASSLDPQMKTAGNGAVDAFSGCDERAMGLFSDIFVVSLPGRMDRRADMERERQALAVNWTWVDATPSNDHIVQTILNEVRHLRDSLSRSNDSLPSFQWPVDMDVFPLPPFAGSDLWTAPTAASSGSPLGVPPTAIAPVPLRPLTCAMQNSTVGPPYEPSLPPYMHLTPAKVACWYSHLQVIRKIAMDLNADTRCNQAALVLEDDVDMEKDIQERLHGIWTALPQGWDVIFLGHCWSNETYYPAVATIKTESSMLQTSLHPSFSPKCTHAYALSRTGALKLLNHLRFPPFAYSRALDQAIAWLVSTGRLNSYSVVPSIVVQRKIGRSDVDGGREGFGSDWRDTLADGVLGT